MSKYLFSLLPFVINAVFLQKISLSRCFSQNTWAVKSVYEIYFQPHKEPYIPSAATHGRPRNGPEERQEAIYRCH